MEIQPSPWTQKNLKALGVTAEGGTCISHEGETQK